MEPTVQISDVAIWIKHIDDNSLQARLRALPDEEPINLETDGVVGRWLKMKTGKDGRPTDAIKPEGSMKHVWSQWYRTRKGSHLKIREVQIADSYLANIESLFPEWESEEDEDAFRDL